MGAHNHTHHTYPIMYDIGPVHTQARRLLGRQDAVRQLRAELDTALEEEVTPPADIYRNVQVGVRARTYACVLYPIFSLCLCNPPMHMPYHFPNPPVHEFDLSMPVCIWATHGILMRGAFTNAVTYNRPAFPLAPLLYF